MDYDNPEIEERWCNECRNDVFEYLQRQGVVHGQVAEWPAWHLAPCVSVWAIESKAAPGSVGWWVIAGDLPTDYVSAANIKHPRDAVATIASRWRDAARQMASGKSLQGFSVGAPIDHQVLSPLLASRAKLLLNWVANPDLWSDL